MDLRMRAQDWAAAHTRDRVPGKQLPFDEATAEVKFAPQEAQRLAWLKTRRGELPASGEGDAVFEQWCHAKVCSTLRALERGQLKAIIKQAFGDATARWKFWTGLRPGSHKAANARGKQLLQALSNPGNIRLPRIVFVPGEVLGDAQAAYHRADRQPQAGPLFPVPSTAPREETDPLLHDEEALGVGGTIYLNDALKASEDLLTRALFEELGHHIVGILEAACGREAPGDEGKVFARGLMAGRPLGDASVPKPVRKAEVEERKLHQKGRDRGVIEVNGEPILVEFSAGVTDHSYCAQKGFKAATTRAAAAEAFEAEVGRLKAKMQERAGDGTVTDEQAKKKLLFGSEHVSKSDRQLRKACDKRVKAHGKTQHQQLLGAVVCVRLQKAEILPKDVSLETALPEPAAGRARANFPAPQPATYGELFTRLLTDADKDGLPDMDAFQLGIYVSADAAQVLRALTDLLPVGDVKAALAAVGYRCAALTDAAEFKAAIALQAPIAFGLKGRGDVSKMQRHMFLRYGFAFTDANKNGRPDLQDAIRFVTEDGKIEESTYGELPRRLRDLVHYNQCVADVWTDYHAQSRGQKILFPNFNHSTGRSKPDRASGEYWEIDEAKANRDQPSWKLLEGKSPAAAIDDALFAHGSAYTSECAQVRSAVGLGALLRFLREEYGDAEGTLRFDARFVIAKQTEAMRAWVRALEAAKRNSGFEFEAYVAEHPFEAGEGEPFVTALELSRHRILGEEDEDGAERPLNLYDYVETAAAPGSPGYLANHGATPKGVDTGYVGENVDEVDDGEFAGHPGGIKAEKRWQLELSSNGITVKSMRDFLQYYEARREKLQSERFTEKQVARWSTETAAAEAETARLEALELTARPGDYAQQLRTQEGKAAQGRYLVGWYHALNVMRHAIADGFDESKVAAARVFFERYDYKTRIHEPAQMGELLDTFTAAVQAQLAEGYDALAQDVRDDFERLATGAMDARAKACAVLFVALTHRERLHRDLREEGLHAADSYAARVALADDGPFASVKNFDAWMQSPEFLATHEGWTQSVADLEVGAIAALMKEHLPALERKKTVYAEVNGGDLLLADQMAVQLKEGELPLAKFVAGTSRVPRGLLA